MQYVFRCFSACLMSASWSLEVLETRWFVDMQLDLKWSICKPAHHHHSWQHPHRHITQNPFCSHPSWCTA